MHKLNLTERDICTKFILPAVKRAGWDEMLQVREEVYFTKGRIIVRGKLVTRGKAKKADVILYYKPNIPIAIIEAKDNNHSVGDGMQQALDYATTLDIPFVFSSNGDGFVFHDRTGESAIKEANLGLDAFPSPADLWARYRSWKGLTPEGEQIVLQDYFDDGSGKAPRYYQVEECNLHTIVRLPNSVFKPYASIGTNLLFFEKGTPTKDIWYYEHRVPVGQKAYSMTRPIRLEYFQDCIDWWGGTERKGRKETPQAWKVSAEAVKARGYNLDIKNPHSVADDRGDPEALLTNLAAAEAETVGLRDQLRTVLAEALAR
jgi:N-6 DNA Methylase/Type I restriction enzyme R protein N terminus (HSDR_N)